MDLGRNFDFWRGTNVHILGWFQNVNIKINRIYFFYLKNLKFKQIRFFLNLTFV